MEERRIIRTVYSGTGSLTEDPSLLAHEILSWERGEARAVYTGFLRSSSIYDVCIREQALGFLECLEPMDKKPAGLLATFEIGHAVHYWLQNQQNFFGARLIGWWECLACGNVRFGTRPRSHCEMCKASPRASIYKEHEIKLRRPFRASGHIDAFLQLPDGRICICDIKTISGDKFQVLNEPLISNVFQVTDYMLLLDYSNDLPVSIDPYEAILLYIPKSHQAQGFPARAFRVRRRPEIEETIRSMREEFTRAIDTRTLPPPLEECLLLDFGGTRSRRCLLRHFCMERAKSGL